jgi:hypothetical protein
MTTVALLGGYHSRDWGSQDDEILLPSPQDPGYHLLPRRNRSRDHRLALHRHHRRSVRLRQSLRVTISLLHLTQFKYDLGLEDDLICFFCSDFFPVALAFMRRLPIIGTFLNIPFVRDVRPPPKRSTI